MFDTMIESCRDGFDAKRAKSATISAGVHLFLILALLGTSVLVVEAVRDPDLSISFVSASAPPLPPAPPPPAGRKPAGAAIKTEPLQLQEIVQPTVVPEQIQEAVTSGSEDGVEGGDENGVAGGERDGLIGGVVNGMIGTLEPAISDEPVIITSDITAPELTHRVEPDYPEIAKRIRIEGRVILQIVVDERGAVSNVRVLQPIQMLEESAIAAVKQWRYKPALRAGKPVKVYVTVTVNFTLR